MKLWPNPRICSQMSEAKFCPDQKENSAINHRRAGEGGGGGGAKTPPQHTPRVQRCKFTLLFLQL